MGAMNGAMNWMRNGEVVALGWTLLHFCWQGTALALLYAIANRLTVHASRNLRYGIGMAALALMPLAAAVTFIEQERLLVHVPRDGQDIVASQLGSIHSTIVNAVPMAAPAVERSELWIAWNADRLLPWVVGIWLAGVLLLALRAAGGWWRLEQIRRDARNMIPVEVEASFRRVAKRLRMGRKIALYVSDEVISPLAMGVWRTAIILPISAVMQLSPEQLEAVLAHEMAHVRRWDYLGNLFQTAVECLLFFHPAVWWVSRRTRDLRELCCDEVAARSCVDPAVYVEALLQLEEQRTERLQLATALHGRGGSLLKRVKQLLGEEITMERETMCGVRIGVLGAVVLALILGPALAKGLKPVHDSTQSTVVQSSVDVAAPVTAPAATPALRRLAAQPAPAVAAEPNVAVLEAPPAVVYPHPPVHAIPMEAMAQDETKKQGGVDYLNKMRDAGYPLDLNKDLDMIITLRSMGVTPEYAKAMAQAGMGTPTLHDLVSLKAVGATPEEVAGLKSSGIAPKDFHDVISEKSLGVTPEYAKAIAGIGLGTPTVHDLISMKAMGITPEYVAEMKASGITAKDLHELVSIKAVGVTPEYAKAMLGTGFTGLSTHDLVSLRAQGVTPEYVRWLKQAYPNADMHELREAAVFHVDADFAAKAKAHGFNDASLDKLVKLKMTGLLD
jgi:beta-lactamase regulating signal transducer with metallopeptidase domain